MSVKIDLGCGGKCITPEHIGIDRAKFSDDVKIVMDIEKDPLPFEENSVDEVYCAHVLEHLDRPEIMIEKIYKILKPGGLFHIVVPYAFHQNSMVPVHKNYWAINSKILFDGSYHEFIKWSNVDWDINFANRDSLKQKILKPLIKKYPSIYEGHLAAICPAAELQFKLIK